MYKKAPSGWMKHFDFILLDQLCLQIAFRLAFFMRHATLNPYGMPIYRNIVVVLALFEFLTAFFGEEFSGILRRGYKRELIAVMKMDITVMLLVTFYLFAIQDAEAYSRIVLFLTGIHYGWLSWLVRICWKRWILSGQRGRSLLILTTSELLDTMSDVKKHQYQGYQITGIALMDVNRIGTLKGEVPIVADGNSVVEYVRGEWVDEVLVILPETFQFEQVFQSFVEMGIIVHRRLTGSLNQRGRRQMLEEFGGYPVLTTSMNIASGKKLLYKRMMDLAGAAVGCLLTILLIFLVGPIIYIQSPGPIFFSQIRVGENGRRFRLYKFRSMYPDAEERKSELMEENEISGELMFKMEDDPRVIGGKHGIGGLMRRFSLDEFPQFFNVLKGEMSLVGTRPPTVEEWERYELRHRARLSIKPGITGMWQVNGRSSVRDFEEVVRLDTEYIENWSIGLDVRIIFQTLRAVIKPRGAY